MDKVSSILLVALGGGALMSLGGFGLLSLRERERRAARVAFTNALILASLFLAAALLPLGIKLAVLGALAAASAVALALFFWPAGKVERGPDQPQTRFDERDTMFARAALAPGSPQHSAYYALRPENRPSDDETRALPGVGSPAATFAHPFAFAAADASFWLAEQALQDAIDGPVAATQMYITVSEMTDFVKNLARYYGAMSVGICELRPYHIYSHIGRGTSRYGEPLVLDHRFAVAFTVEMDYDQLGPAPAATVYMESGRQYAEASKVAIQLASAMRSFGYAARAHISAHYQIIAPLVARDAGLGEIGRMGILMTPQVGPRVRLGVVTTNLPLLVDQRSEDTSMLDFCRICKKCADGCPSRSIPKDDRQMIDGALRWRINPDTCFRYWQRAGTDCGRCMSICPYAHPNNLAHNAVRWVIRRSGFGRRAALWLDDAFYGRKPRPRPMPSWIPRTPPARGSGH